MNDIKKTIVMILFSILFIFSFYIKIGLNDKVYSNYLLYNGKKYVYLDYSNDIFIYDYNNKDNIFMEVDEIHKLKHKNWDMIYQEGDIFVSKSDIKSASKYYNDDDNYDWYIIIDNEDDEDKYSIDINHDELKRIYNMNNIKKEEKILFEDIEKFGSIVKVSKDDMVYGLISICYYNNNWYYKTEIMDDDYEYIIKLPDTLNKKINNLRK